MRTVGVGLCVAAWGVLFFKSSYSPAYTQARPHPDPLMLAITIAGIALAVIPIRRGERWALLTELVMLVIVLVTRFTTGAQRLVILEPHQHGYSFMVAAGLAAAGLALAWR
jgi:hypothetical protein